MSNLSFKIPDKNPLDLNKKLPGYFNKKIFRTYVLLIILLVLYTWYTNDFRNEFVYYECPENSYSGCLISSNDDYNGIFLAPGAGVGEKPNNDYFSFNKRLWLIILLAFVNNHFFYVFRNKKFIPEWRKE